VPLILAPPPPPAADPGPAFAISRSRVWPRRAFAAGRPLRIAFAFRATAPAELTVAVRRRGRAVRSWRLPAAPPSVTLRLAWRGITSRGKIARDGRYRVVVTPAGGRPVQIGGFVLRGHAYPVRGPHGFRGAIGRFGAPRSGGRTHEGFDVNAACGTPVVAARAGTVRVSDYDPVLYGHRVIVRARGERRGYWFTHLRSPSPLRAGDRVATGGRIGRIGATGNAVTVGCHLHFELRGRGGPLDPEPELRLWDRWS